ncbi:MAG TPA: hypothetical protein DCL48_11245 [Alphaproteobacteria bacterium]|nr:hypothetical protein [Alphaproteobacteria bacterium]
MDLVARSEREGHFYVPAFCVVVAGRDILRDHKAAVVQAEVDLTIGGASRFSFTIQDAFDFETRQFRVNDKRVDLLSLLKFGTPVTISMGYGESANLVQLISGTVSHIAPNFPETGSPEIVVSGYDHAFRLTAGKSSRTWKAGSLDSDAVAEIANFHSLNADIVPTKSPREQIVQKHESDLEFALRLAKQNGYEIYVRGSELRFGPARLRDKAVLTMEWGRGLLSFKPEANLAGQYTSVEVSSWDAKTAQTIIGRATRGQELGRDPREQSAGDMLAGVLRHEAILRVREPVNSQSEATNLAIALLKEQSERFLTGDVETIGVPEIIPDRNVTLAGLGQLFSKTYYVEQATHSANANGYRTRFKVREATL